MTLENENSNNGFTLIEVIIYMALFSILISSGFIAAYQIISSGEKLNKNIGVEKEAQFLSRKIVYVMSNLDKSRPPVVSGTGCNQVLTVYKTGVINPTRLRLNTQIEIQDDGINYYPLTTENVSVTCLKFSLNNGSPIGIIATTTVNGTDYVTNKYARI